MSNKHTVSFLFGKEVSALLSPLSDVIEALEEPCLVVGMYSSTVGRLLSNSCNMQYTTVGMLKVE